MTRSARRRWSTDPDFEIDGLALAADGPVVVHGYEPPAGGKWADDVIPGKVQAYDRQTGARIWGSPCEVGYGRGFGAGFDAQGALVILGPGQSGHRIARMSLEDGVLLGVERVPEFDEALVGPDLCVCVGPTSISGVLTEAMTEAWRFRKEGLRFHRAARCGDEVFVVFSSKGSRTQGLLVLDALEGRFVRELLPPNQKAILGLSAGQQALAMVVEDLESALPPEAARDYMLRRLMQESGDEPLSEGPALGLVVLSPRPGQAPLWFEDLRPAPGDDELLDPTVRFDSGKLYLARGAMLDVRDALTGRELGSAVVPGLDEFVAWSVADGAFLVAEETRATVFEIPD
jgi:hypothetical protein